ncbi:MAG: hypothetical protein HGB35_03780 [Geobacteraceae bacterium]|nr:hypothetical protein [Geobacteraceae bacterium]
MKRLHSFLSFIVLLLCFPAIAALSKEAVRESSGYEVISADFGIFETNTSGKPVFVPTVVVPLTPNQGYGWVMLIRTDKPSIKWREEFTLPAIPATWGDSHLPGTSSVSADGLTSITEREVSPDQGVISNSWEVAPGDPQGHYVIRVFVEGSLAKVFEFDVK